MFFASINWEFSKNVNEEIYVWFQTVFKSHWYFFSNPEMIRGGAAIVGSLIVQGKITLDSSLDLALAYRPESFSHRSDWLHLETWKRFSP